MKTAIVVALIAAIAIGGALGAFAATRTVQTEATVEVKVWQSVTTGNLYLSTRPDGGDWTTHSTPLDMSELSDSGSFYESSSVLVIVPIEAEIQVPADPTPMAISTPSPTLETEPGTCCEVRGMSDFPPAQEAVVEEMQEVVRFGNRRYELEHSGPITINISHTVTGLFVRFRDAFGTRPEKLPSECSFQRGEHIFFGPACRSDEHAFATEWFRRATGSGGRGPAWVGQGTTDYFASHYVDGEAPYLEHDRFLRVIFYQNPEDLRRSQASGDLMTTAVAYAIREHGGSRTWFDLHGAIMGGADPGAAFQEALGISLLEFYDAFERWATRENADLHADAFASCAEAGQSLHLQGGTAGTDAGYPDFRVPSEVDEDGDGIVCEGFTPLGDIDRR
ncbi:MAG: hypothetical protein OXE43_04675 [Chloroflexi bacterium]|nr:hypothetical protein [Chloroflexota bacterium]